jgi:hypothetical protein
MANQEIVGTCDTASASTAVISFPSSSVQTVTRVKGKDFSYNLLNDGTVLMIKNAGTAMDGGPFTQDKVREMGNEILQLGLLKA